MITLGFRNLEVATSFYAQALGFPRKKSSEDIAFFILNGICLALYSQDALAEDAGVDYYGIGFKGCTLYHNVSTEQEVDEIYADTFVAGAAFIKEPQIASWGGYSGYFKDLDGYIWEVAFNPFTWIGPQDEKTPFVEPS